MYIQFSLVHTRMHSLCVDAITYSFQQNLGKDNEKLPFPRKIQ